MKMIRFIAPVVLIVGLAFAVHVARAQQPGIKRTELQRHDLSIPDGKPYRYALISMRERHFPNTRILVKRSFM